MRILLSFIIASLIISCYGQSDITNLAVHKKYMLSEQANYKLTRGNDDKDLTDGKKKTGKRFWQDKSTVGWLGKEKVTIDLDLEEVNVIEEIKLNTARGEIASVRFPSEAYVFLSADDKKYVYAGDIMYDHKNIAGDYKVKEFSLKDIKSKARFVKLVVIPNGKYLFLDEIEVLKGDDSQRISKSGNNFRKSEIDDKVKKLIIKHRQAKHSINQSNLLKKQIEDLGSSIEISPSQQKYSVEKTAIKKQLEELKAVKTELIKRKYGAEPFKIREINPWGNWKELSYTDFKNDNELGEYSNYRAFEILNTQMTKQEFSINKPTSIRLYTVPLSPSETGVFDALVPFKSDKLTIEPGESVFIFYKKKEQKEQALIEVSLKNHKKRIEILPSINLNNNEILNANVWMYLDYPVIKKNKKGVVQDIESHSINTIVINGNYVPKIGDHDFQKLSSYLEEFSNLSNKKILLFSNNKHESRRNTQDGKEFLSKEWKAVFKNWYKELLTVLSIAGVDKKEVYYYPFDEIQKEYFQYFQKLSEWSKKDFNELKLFLTIHQEEALGMVPYAAISQITPSFSRKAKEKYPDSEIWQYTVISNSREKNAYTQYRLMAWEAFLYDYKGIGFWNYFDVNSFESNKENNYSKLVHNKMADHTVVYTDKEEIVSSRRWEAFSQGLRDYKIISAYANKKGRQKAKKKVKEVLDYSEDVGKADLIINEMLSEEKL